MKMPLVSIIIPFYNDEQFLERAVCSAIAQTYAYIEIVLVNDGSTDYSSQIAKKFKAINETVILLNCEHHSIGRARNIGIQKASGKYIAFLDSDDEMEIDAIQKLVFVMESEKVDVVIGGFGLYDMKGQVLKRSGANHLSGCLNNIDATIALCKEKIARVVWSKLFKTEIARQIRFPESIWFEDGPFLMAYFYKCNNNILVTDIPTTKHYCRPDSVTRRLFTKKRIEDTFAAFEIEWMLTMKNTQQKLISTHLFAYYQRALMNCLVIMTMDRRKINDLKVVENSVRNFLKMFYNVQAQNNVSSGPRTRIDRGFVQLHNIIGWRLFYNIFPFLKRNLFRKIAKIRSIQN